MIKASILKNHQEDYPYMEPQDLVKLLFQAYFGGEHMLDDLGHARAYLRREFEGVEEEDGDLLEAISEDYMRVNLRPWKARALPQDWLFEIFVNSMEKKPRDKMAFISLLREIENRDYFNNFSFSKEDWQTYLEAYLKEGPRAVHHSQTYRKEARPAYRLASRAYKNHISILEAMAQLVKDKDRLIIAIDGRSGAGKSTLARELAKITGATILAMDDFFLPRELRSQERLAEAGGNIHYERFLEEVVDKVNKGQEISFRPFDCSLMDYGEKKHLGLSQILIVEGAYSHHPKLGDYMDLRVFYDLDRLEQEKRILKRNGKEVLEIYKKRWIPLEEAYIVAHSINEKADLIISS